MKGFLVFKIHFPEVGDGFAVLRMGIQIETGVHAGKAGGSNQAEQLVLGEAAAGAGGFRARRAGTGRRSLLFSHPPLSGNTGRRPERRSRYV